MKIVDNIILKSFRFLILFSMLFLPVHLIFAFDTAFLANLLSNQIKKSPIAEEVQIGQIKFIGVQPHEKCIPDEIKIREIKRPNIIEFTFKCQNKQYRAIASYEILANVYITQIPLKRGDVITEDKIIEIKQPVSRLPVGAITDKNLLIGKTLRRSLAKGLIIKNDYLYSGLPVKRGSKVDLIINAGQVMIMTEGVLKSDGVVGENVRVQCFQTGKEIVGTLIDKDKVRVLL